jgi:hypothetical protein
MTGTILSRPDAESPQLSRKRGPLHRREQPRKRTRVTTIGLDLGLGDRPQLLRGSDDHARSVGLQQPRDRKRVAGRFQRHVILPTKAIGQNLHPLRAARDAACKTHLPASQIAISQKSRWTSSPMNRTSAPFTRLRRESRWANDKNGFGLAAQPGESQGRPKR